MPGRFVRLLLVFACSVPVIAQETRAGGLRHRIATLQPGSLEWFWAQAELAEALFDVDVAAARTVAEDAWRLAATSRVVGAAETMAALAELATCKLDGPANAATWAIRATTIPDTAADALLGHYHLARARTLCKHGEHAEELRHAIAGQAAAEKIGDPILQLEIALHTVHATPLRDLERLRAVLATGLAGPRAHEVAALRPWVSLQGYVDAGNNGGLEEASPLLDEAEAAAVADGNRCVIATVLGYRASRFVDRCAPFPDADTAAASIERAVAIFADVGDRRELAIALGMKAMLEVRRGAFSSADETLARASAVLKDRGMGETEDQLRHVRFELAVRSGDGNRAAALAAELEEQGAAAAAVARDVRHVRDDLERAEKDHAAAEAGLRETARLADERSQRIMAWAGAGVILALTLLAVVTWRSRRRLIAANRLLAEQVARTEAATAARGELEARMRQLERTQSLGAIAAGVAHDFNNLLTGILGNAELITMLGRGDDAAEFARRIVAAGKQAARMCQQMQQCAGNAPMQAEALDLLRMFHDMLPVLRASVGDGVEIAIATVADRLGAIVDRSQLEQVLLNLVVNARDAKATRVVLRTAAAPVDEQDPGRGRFVTIEVADNGEGMMPDVAERIFDPFFTTRFPGRGLGLAVASGIVSRHGGSIEVHSAPGRGTTFTILLPAAAPSAKEPTVVLPSIPPTPRHLDGDLVVIDDDEGVRRVLAGMLRSLGGRVTEFADGASALAALPGMATTRPVFLFVDLTMPGMEGQEVVRAARAVRADVRIVLMSGHAGAHVEQIARDLAPDAVLGKPFSLDRLRTLLAALAAGPVSAPRG